MRGGALWAIVVLLGVIGTAPGQSPIYPYLQGMHNRPASDYGMRSPPPAPMPRVAPPPTPAQAAARTTRPALSLPPTPVRPVGAFAPPLYEGDNSPPMPKLLKPNLPIPGDGKTALPGASAPRATEKEKTPAPDGKPAQPVEEPAKKPKKSKKSKASSAKEKVAAPAPANAKPANSPPAPNGPVPSADPTVPAVQPPANNLPGLPNSLPPAEAPADESPAASENAAAPPAAATEGAPQAAPAPQYQPCPTPVATEFRPACGRSACFWGGGEYLLWWVKRGPLATPLVTTTTAPGTPRSGDLGQPETTVLFGDSGLQYGTVSGMRYTLGTWLGEEQRLGLEVRAFLLERRLAGFSAASDGLGNPPLYLPATNVTLGPRALLVSDPLAQFSGSVSIASRSRFWGGEANSLVNLGGDESFGLDLLVGFRYLDLDENLQLDNTTTDLVIGTVDRLTDRFEARNQFYGGQLGARASLARGPLWAQMAAKVALGSTRQSVRASGSITESGPGAAPAGTFPGGFYTQPTNIGTRSADRFGVVPEAEIRVGYELLPSVGAFVGYNFLYWSQVVRPGDQIDPLLNLTQSPVFGTGTLTGPGRPAPQFNRSDFFVHGVSFGVQVLY